jgi:hypothetical protein
LWYLCMWYLHKRRSRRRCCNRSRSPIRSRSTKRRGSRRTGTPRPTCRRRPGPGPPALPRRGRPRDRPERSGGTSLQLVIVCEYPNRRVHEPQARTQAQPPQAQPSAGRSSRGAAWQPRAHTHAQPQGAATGARAATGRGHGRNHGRRLSRAAQGRSHRCSDHHTAAGAARTQPHVVAPARSQAQLKRVAWSHGQCAVPSWHGAQRSTARAPCHQTGTARSTTRLGTRQLCQQADTARSRHR